MDAHVALMRDLAALGKELGYHDVELNKWVTAQLQVAKEEAKAAEEKAQADADREERRLAREEQRKQDELRQKKEEIEAQERRWTMEEEMKKEELRLKDKQLAIEEQTRRNEVDAQVAIKKMELEFQQAKSNKKVLQVDHSVSDDEDTDDNASETHRKVKAGPKLPFFDDTKDDIDSYLRRFERYSELQKWPKADWALYLSALLKGKSLECYSRLAEPDARDYDKLKAALLRQFDLTAEGFRKKFYEARRGKDETAAQFVVRLIGYLDRWIQLTEIKRTYEGLKALLVRERFLDSCDERLSLYLRERSPKDLDEVVSLADHYIDARANKLIPAKSNFNAFGRKQTSGKPYTPSPNTSNSSSDSARAADNTSHNRLSKVPYGEERVCYNCGQPGHIRRFCKRKSGTDVMRGGHDSAAACEVVHARTSARSDKCKHLAEDHTGVRLSCGCELPYAGCLMVGHSPEGREKRLDVVQGRLGGQVVTCLRDTGCTTGVVRSSLVKHSQLTGRRKCFRMLDGTLRQADTAVICLESPIYSGELECLCVASPICDVVVGNVPGACGNVEGGTESVNAVTTRAQARTQGKPPKPMLAPIFSDLHVSVADMVQMQKESRDLSRSFQLSRTGETVPAGKSGTVRFVMKRDLLHRVYTAQNGVETKQLVVPQPLRKGALGLAHESMMAGHLGVSKTLDRLTAYLWWPGICADVTRFVRSCDACQRTMPKGRIAKAPLQRMPIIGVPFQRVGIDLVGPISPPSSSGNRFILCVVDYATRYPEAVALPGITTEQVAEALCRIFSRMGVPNQILSDQGSQFVSAVMQEVYRLLSIQHITSTPYHAQSNGLVEKFNGTLKSMIKKLCLERPVDWDRYLEPALFAYREVKQDSLGFSPFELIYGRTIRGPMAILRELWSKDVPDEDLQSTYQYVFDLRNRMEETCKLVEQSLRETQTKAKKHFDRKAKARKLQIGDKVLILLPTNSHKMLMTWKGPYTVVQCIGLTDYRIQLESCTKVFHINMLKKYFDRETPSMVPSSESEAPVDDDDDAVVEDVAAGVLEEDDSDSLELFVPGSVSSEPGSVDEVHVNPELSKQQTDALWKLLRTYSDIFSNKPGCTDIAEHKILLTDSNPVRAKTYPVPYSLRETVKEELADMFKLGVIEPSDSPYSSPLLMLKKKDGTNRPVVDYRNLNRVTVFDAEPMPNADDIFARLAGSRFYSKMDFCKGYWQIPMSDSDRPKTAFSTPVGLYQFRRMPFGLQNAGATYGRMMRKLLEGLEATDNFVDDVLTFTDGWERHLDELRELFERIRQARLTVKPSKCHFGYQSVEFLGHHVGNGNLEMLSEKVEQVISAPVPRTKKQLRAFLGLSGYYRRFIENYAMIVAPLTDALKGGGTTTLNWSSAQDKAFAKLKELLCAKPILRLPDTTKPFVLRTDASDVGLGAVLLQEHEDGIFPVAYASRKLSRAERNYSVVERECLAIVWAVAKFYRWLYGRQFVLQTDHRPLTFLDRAKMANARVMRWALALQPFSFRTESIKGSDNVGADYLSRVEGSNAACSR